MHPNPRVFTSIALALFGLAGPAIAQIGSAWSSLDPQQYVHTQKHNTETSSAAYDSSPQMLRSAWMAQDREHNHELEGMNGSHWPAEYDYIASTRTEVFSLYGDTTDTGNRCEVRVQDNYGVGQKRQLEGYVTIYSPTHLQNVLQIWGSTSGASQMMIMAAEDNGGSLGIERNRSGGDLVLFRSGVYGQEIKINVIHLQNTSVGSANGKFQVYADGVLLEEFVDNEDPTNGGLNHENYIKYGIYQTVLAGHENPKVVWKDVNLYQGGAVPGTTSQTISIPGNPTAITKNVGDPAFSLGATASSGLGVSYRSDNPLVATVSGGNIQIVGPGTAVIWVNQNGNGTYKPAPSKKVVLTVSPRVALYEAAYHTGLTTSTPRISCGTFSSAQNKLTVAFWAKATALANQQPIDKLPATYATNNQGWSVKLRSDGAVWFRLGAENSYSDVRLAANTYAAGTWVHVACTFDGTTQKVFINGAVPANGTLTTPAGFNVVGNTDLSVGRPSVAATTNIYSGDLRDVRFYDRVLSNAEIGVLAVLPQWLMNGPTNFDGTAGDYMSGGTYPGSATALTVAFFANAAAFGNMQPVDKLPLDATAPNGAAGGWSVKMRSDGDVWFRVGNETTNTTAKYANAYAPGMKVHLACTFGGGVAKVYCDGVELTDYAGVAGSIAQSVANSVVEMRLAVPQRAATTNIFHGDLERVRVFHQVLTAAQVGLLADGL